MKEGWKRPRRECVKKKREEGRVQGGKSQRERVCVCVCVCVGGRERK